jgi:hypothetical protein
VESLPAKRDEIVLLGFCPEINVLLGWQPRSSVDALVAAAEGLIKFGLVNEI